jgi:hypothetical protein
VKDLKVGKMYRIKDQPTDPGRTFCHGSDCDSVYVAHDPCHHKSIGTKMVYLGTRVHRRFERLRERIGLFGDKVLSIEPEAWRHIEPMEDE